MGARKLRFYEFGPFRLDVRARLLLHEGEIVPLTLKVFETLLLLVENRDRLLEKEVLISRLWPDSFVEESSLAQNISRLRKALGGGPSGQYIITFPKRGYLFTADVDEIFDEGELAPQEEAGSSETAPAEGAPAARPAGTGRAAPAGTGPRPARRLSRKAYALVGCAAVVLLSAAAFLLFRRPAPAVNRAGDLRPRSMAILPFKTVGTESEAELLGFGMADTLTVKMTNLQGVSVLPTSSVYKYSQGGGSSVEIGRELGVDAVLDGTVQRSGELVRVSAQLIRVADGTTLWAAKFDERFSNIFEVHDLVAEQLARVLSRHLTADDRARLSKRYTKDPEAYEAYLTGAYFWNKRTREALTRAVDYFKQAIGKDPQYALAYAMLADCYFLSLVNGYEIVPPAAARANQIEAANKAMELDTTLAEAHMVMAPVREYQGDYEEAEQEYRRVFDLNPSHAIAHLRYSYFLLHSLDLDNSVRHMRLAQQFDPVSPTANAALCYMLTLAREYDEAIRYCRRAIELDPDVRYGRLSLGEAYLQKEMYDEARAEFQRLPAEQRLISRQVIAYTEARAGRRDAALQILSELQNSPEADQIPDYHLVLILTALGDKDKAFARLKNMSLTRFTIALLKYDPQLDPLRSDPRFNSYLRSKGLGHLAGGE